MTKFILHGGMTSKPCENNDKYYKEIMDSADNPVKILLVYFAKPKGTWEEIFENHKELFLKRAGGKEVELTVASENEGEFAKQADSHNVIFIRGGSTPMLQAQLEKIPNFKELIKDKVVSGSSAGSLVFAKYYYDQDYDKIFEGLNILHVKMMTHYLSNGEYAATSGKDKLAKLKAYREDLPTYAIPETEFIIIKK